MIALDLFCGAGGASVGLHRSGLFERIVGVDLEPQPNYPFEFVQADALEYDVRPLDPDFIWASPPCQPFVSLAAMPDSKAASDVPNLIPATRALLEPHPWTCIENVRDAPIRPDIRLEGGNVGIPHMNRHRKFEVSWTTGLHSPPFTIKPILYRIWGSWYGGRTTDKLKTQHLRVARGMTRGPSLEEVEELWDVDWLTSNRRHALTQMVPPAYALYIVNDAVKHGYGL